MDGINATIHDTVAMAAVDVEVSFCIGEVVVLGFVIVSIVEGEYCAVSMETLLLDCCTISFAFVVVVFGNGPPVLLLYVS